MRDLSETEFCLLAFIGKGCSGEELIGSVSSTSFIRPIPKGTVHVLLGRLRSRGMLSASVVPDDARRRLYRSTSKGRLSVRRMRDHYNLLSSLGVGRP